MFRTPEKQKHVRIILDLVPVHIAIIFLMVVNLCVFVWTGWLWWFWGRFMFLKSPILFLWHQEHFRMTTCVSNGFGCNSATLEIWYWCSRLKFPSQIPIRDQIRSICPLTRCGLIVGGRSWSRIKFWAGNFVREHQYYRSGPALLLQKQPER